MPTCKHCKGTGKPTPSESGIVFTCACGKCGECHGEGTVSDEVFINRIDPSPLTLKDIEDAWKVAEEIHFFNKPDYEDDLEGPGR